MRTLEEEKILQEFFADHKYQCKVCGRKEIMTKKVEKCICSHCHRYIYKDAEEYKKYLFKLIMRGEIKAIDFRFWLSL